MIGSSKISAEKDLAHVGDVGRQYLQLLLVEPRGFEPLTS